jgi:hypothetical protein
VGLNIYGLYRVFQPGFRSRRLRLFLDSFHPGPATRILDVGGHPYDWADVTPVTSPITFLKVTYPPMGPVSQRFTCLVGDGRKMEFSDRSFDIVFSNSVIEHVGGWEDQKRFASEIRRVAKQVFVQTPNRFFFIEPHFGAIFIHLLPWRIAKRLLCVFSFRGLFRRGDNVAVKQLADELRLLSIREVRELFPDCEIHREKWLGMTKSFVAIRKAAGARVTSSP